MKGRACYGQLRRSLNTQACSATVGAETKELDVGSVSYARTMRVFKGRLWVLSGLCAVNLANTCCAGFLLTCLDVLTNSINVVLPS